MIRLTDDIIQSENFKKCFDFENDITMWFVDIAQFIIHNNIDENEFFKATKEIMTDEEHKHFTICVEFWLLQLQPKKENAICIAIGEKLYDDFTKGDKAK